MAVRSVHGSVAVCRAPAAAAGTSRRLRGAAGFGANGGAAALPLDVTRRVCIHSNGFKACFAHEAVY